MTVILIQHIDYWKIVEPLGSSETYRVNLNAKSIFQQKNCNKY